MSLLEYPLGDISEMQGTGLDLIAELHEMHFEQLKVMVVAGDKKVYSFGIYRDLGEHIKMLREEFAGSSMMLLYHAILMVLIRRRIDLAENIVRVERLWREEGAYLAQNLDSRWLVSACDTIADYWPAESDRALALAGALFANTIKLYETERVSTGDVSVKPVYRDMSKRVALHDGMAAFVIGRGDLICNLFKRVNAGTGSNGGAPGLILGELVKRASLHDTVFKRFKDVHRDPKTIW